jgi:hypothetical protein
MSIAFKDKECPTTHQYCLKHGTKGLMEKTCENTQYNPSNMLTTLLNSVTKISEKDPHPTTNTPTTHNTNTNTTTIPPSLPEMDKNCKLGECTCQTFEMAWFTTINDIIARLRNYKELLEPDTRSMLLKELQAIFESYKKLSGSDNSEGGLQRPVKSQGDVTQIHKPFSISGYIEQVIEVGMNRWSIDEKGNCSERICNKYAKLAEAKLASASAKKDLDEALSITVSGRVAKAKAKLELASANLASSSANSNLAAEAEAEAGAGAGAKLELAEAEAKLELAEAEDPENLSRLEEGLYKDKLTNNFIKCNFFKLLNEIKGHPVLKIFDVKFEQIHTYPEKVAEELKRSTDVTPTSDSIKLDKEVCEIFIKLFKVTLHLMNSKENMNDMTIQNAISEEICELKFGLNKLDNLYNPPLVGGRRSKKRGGRRSKKRGGRRSKKRYSQNIISKKSKFRRRSLRGGLNPFGSNHSRSSKNRGVLGGIFYAIGFVVWVGLNVIFLGRPLLASKAWKSHQEETEEKKKLAVQEFYKKRDALQVLENEWWPKNKEAWEVRDVDIRLHSKARLHTIKAEVHNPNHPAYKEARRKWGEEYDQEMRERQIYNNKNESEATKMTNKLIRNKKHKINKTDLFTALMGEYNCSGERESYYCEDCGVGGIQSVCYEITKKKREHEHEHEHEHENVGYKFFDYDQVKEIYQKILRTRDGRTWAGYKGTKCDACSKKDASGTSTISSSVV